MTLDLARLFHAAGHTVLIAESIAWPLARFSRTVARFYAVPPPRFQPEAFIQALLDIICTEQIDLLLPTCEETFYVALGREALAAYCQVPARSACWSPKRCCSLRLTMFNFWTRLSRSSSNRSTPVSPPKP